MHESASIRQAEEREPRPARQTGNRIKMITTDPDTGPVGRFTLAKGYAVEKNMRS